LFVVLLAMAAVPAWTLGQGEAKPVAPGDTQQQGELDNAREQDAAPETAAKVMEAKIAELSKQLAELKKRKEAAEQWQKDKAQLEWLDDLNMKMTELKKRQQAAESTKKAETGDAGPKFKIWLSQDGKPEQRIGVIVLDDPTKVAPAADPKQGATGAAEKSETGQPNVKYKVMQIQGGDLGNNTQIKIGNDVKIVADPVAPHTVGFKFMGAEHGGVNMPQVRVIGPDGKEIKNVKVLISNGDAQSEPKSAGPDGDGKFLFKVQTGPGAPVVKVDPKKPGDAVYIRTPSVAGGSPSKAVILARVTYKLPKSKAEALAAFLKTNVNSSVLEFRLEEGALTITTTPETQAVVGSIVGLMQSDKDLGAYYKALQKFPYPLEGIKEKKK
jgi:TolA-binding protein